MSKEGILGAIGELVIKQAAAIDELFVAAGNERERQQGKISEEYADIGNGYIKGKGEAVAEYRKRKQEKKGRKEKKKRE